MGANTSRVVSLVIELKDKASAGLKDISGNVMGKLGAATRVVTAALLSGAVAVAGYAAAFLELAKRGGEVLAVQRAFGASAVDISGELTRLRMATDGLVSNYDLMVSYNKALTLGAVKNTKDFAELSEVAVKLGHSVGVDAASAVQLFSEGLGRQSDRMLEQLGIKINADEVEKRYAEKLGVTTSQLTAQEKATAFVNAAMAAARARVAEVGEGTDNAALAMTRFKVSMANLKDEAAKFAANSPILETFFNKLAEVADKTGRVIAAGGPTIKLAMSELGLVAANAFANAFLTALITVLDAPLHTVLPKKVAEFIDKLNPVRRVLAGARDAAGVEMDKGLVRLGNIADSAPGPTGSGGGLGGGGGRGMDPRLEPGTNTNVRTFTADPMIGMPKGGLALKPIEDMSQAWRANMTMVQGLGIALGEAGAKATDLNDIVAKGGVAAFKGLGDAVMIAAEEWAQGSASMGAAFVGALLGALAQVAKSFGDFYMAKAAASLGDALLGDPRGWAAAAKYAGAATAFYAVAGLAAGAGRNVSGGGGAGGAAGASSFNTSASGIARGKAVVVIRGGLLDMSDPKQAQALADAIQELTLTRDVEIQVMGS